MIQARTLSVVFLILILCFPLVVPPFWITLMNHIGIGSLVTLGLVFLTGVGGMMSFGQAAFVGIAAYSTGWLTTAIGLSPWAGLVFALALTLSSAFIIGLITLRLGGHFLPISTIAWGISIYYLFGNLEALGGHTGLPNIPPVTLGPISFISSTAMYYLIWSIAAAAMWFSANLLNSRKGRAFRLLRGGSQLMESVGMDTFRARLAVFMLAALYAGFAGWLYAHMTRFVSPAPFEVKVSIEYLLMAIVGGASNVFGAVLGAGAVVTIKNWLQDVLPHVSANPAQLEQIAFALFLILLLHCARGGFSPLLQKLVARKEWEVSQTDKSLSVRKLPESGAPVLEIEGVDRRFGGLHAVKKMSFSVAAGEIVALIGPNGAGKSTMFNLITGTLPVNAGHIRFIGSDVTEASQKSIAAMGCARTFQHVKLRPGMSLLDNVAAGAYLRTNTSYLEGGLRLDQADEASVFAEAYRCLEQVGLAAHANDPAGDLPLGQQRILEIARALAADPILLILDEPAAGLRKQEKDALSELLRNLRAGGLTILIVEHDMDFVMNLVDRIVVMVFGEKLCEGVPSDVRRDPKVHEAYLGGVAE